MQSGSPPNFFEKRDLRELFMIQNFLLQGPGIGGQGVGVRDQGPGVRGQLRFSIDLRRPLSIRPISAVLSSSCFTLSESM